MKKTYKIVGKDHDEWRLACVVYCREDSRVTTDKDTYFLRMHELKPDVRIL